jgi:menaquinone-9 beta-reductase
MERYKTVIVGGGPGGLRCAKILAENGEDFILLEGKPGPDTKICTGLWGITEKTRYVGLPDDIFERKFRRVLFSTAHRRADVRMKTPFVATLNRKRLSEWMHREARKAGANIEFGSVVTGIGRDYVSVGRKKIGFDFLVGADGSSSLVRRSIGLKQDVGIGIQYWIGEEYRDLELHLDYNTFGPWYGWIVPHGGTTSIGTGGYTGFMPLKIMKRNLSAWCRQKEYDISGVRFEGAPISNDYRGFRFGNRFLVGDAAGLASGFTGEGIYFAMVSGEDVAKTIISREHNPALIRKVLGIKRKHELILSALRFSRETGTAGQGMLLELLRFGPLKKRFIELMM